MRRHAVSPLYFYLFSRLSKTGFSMANYQRQSILCPNCRKLISVSEQRCPYCGISGPGSRLKNNIWTRGFSDPKQIVFAIMAVNIGMYVISLLLFVNASSLSLNPLRFLSPTDTSLLLLGATGTAPIDQFHLILQSIGIKPIEILSRWWTLVSAGYLHGGIVHIAFNMMAIRNLAPIVIREFGVYRMFSIYSFSNVIGFLVSYLAGIPLTIGASAGILGLVGALLYFGKSRGGVYGTAIYKQLGMWVVILFAIGFIVPVINNWGHGGGLLGGAVCGFLLGYHDRKKEKYHHKAIAGVWVAVTLLVLVWAVSTGVYYRVVG